ncbi:MAG: REP-associated tyrosine transposase, partial [Vicinamibacterales bacterium]
MPNRPCRLRGFDYRGFHSYFLTICTNRRRPVFSDLTFGYVARDQLLQRARVRYFALLAYCLMPDHVHILAQGQTSTASLRPFINGWNTWTGREWRKAHRSPLWQGGYYDHVLRDSESFLGAARYIVMNPVRAGLVQRSEDY